MLDIENSLRIELNDPEYSEGYAESFMNSFVATQIKVLREQRVMTQAQLGEAIGTTQAGISRIEDVNYSSWSIKTLIKLARAFNVRLKVSFEPYGTLPGEVVTFNRAALQRPQRKDDPGLTHTAEKIGPKPAPSMIYQDMLTGGQNDRKVVSILDAPARKSPPKGLAAIPSKKEMGDKYATLLSSLG
jgi:transcriptional regulator with XRE-family HTH domain